MINKKSFLAEIWAAAPGAKPSSEMNVVFLSSKIHAVSVLEAIDVLRETIATSGLLHFNLSIELEQI